MILFAAISTFITVLQLSHKQGFLRAQVEDDLARQKRQLSALKERNCRLKLENAELRDKAALLERLDLRQYNTKSACMLEFTHFKIKETY